MIEEKQVPTTKKNSKTKRQKKASTAAVLITISEFAERIDVSYTTAYEMAGSKFFMENGLSTNINIHNDKKGGTRINWPKYLAELEKQEEIPKTNKKLLWGRAI